jgi:hypothetical protein
MLIKSLPNQSLDDGLPADVHVPRGLIELLQHCSSEVDVDALDRMNHTAFSFEETRDVLPFISETSDCFRADWLGGFTSFLHTNGPPPSSTSTGDEMKNLSLFVVSNLENDCVQAAAHPADGAVLLGHIRPFLEPVRTGEQSLHFLEADAAPRICLEALALFEGRN